MTSADVDTVTAAFVERFGSAPAGVWSAPGRVNLIGEHVDYQGGLSLPIALEHGTFAAVQVRSDDTLALVSLDRPGESWRGQVGQIGPGEPTGWPGYLAGVLWALREEGVAVPGVEVVVASTVPIGAGLSSSASLECSFVLALADLLGLPTDDTGRAMLAAACVRAENDIVGASTGGLDQAVSLRAQAGHAVLFDAAAGSARPVALPLEGRGLALRAYDTGAPHQLVDSEYAARRGDCALAARLLGVSTLREITDLDGALHRLAGTDGAARLIPRVRHVVTEIERVTQVVGLLEGGQVEEVGPVLDASHHSLQVDYAVTSSELDAAVDAARRAGALGARMTGGGFGGSVVALLRANDIPRVDAQVMTVFAGHGWAPPTPVAVQAAAAAHRTR